MEIPSAATDATKRRVAASSEDLPLADTQDFDDAIRGFVARSEERHIRADDGRVVWDLDAYAFLDGPAPSTAHPSDLATLMSLIAPDDPAFAIVTL